MPALLKPVRIEHVVDGLALRAQLTAIWQSQGEAGRDAVKELLEACKAIDGSLA